MAEAKAVKEFTLEEIKGHTSSSDCWLVIGNASNGASWKFFGGMFTVGSVCLSFSVVVLQTLYKRKMTT
jgi:hypothetical protein